MMTDELKPCPFCGSKAKIVYDDSNDDLHFAGVRVCCQNLSCGAKGVPYFLSYDAIESWNARPLESALLAEIERLRDALKSLRIDKHAECDDCWYSCPKSDSGCCDRDQPKDECTCGMDAQNEIIDKALLGGE